MKEFYNKLRSEHIELIRTKADCEKQLSIAKTTIDELRNSNETMESQLSDTARKEAEISAMSFNNAALQTQMATLRNQCASLTQKLETSQKECKEYLNKIALLKQDVDRQTGEIAKLKQNHSKEMKENYKLIITQFISQSVEVSKRIMDQDLELGFASVNCTPQYFSSQVEHLISKLTPFENSILKKEYSIDLFMSAFHYFYQLFYTMNCSKTTIQNLPNLELSDELLSACVQFISRNFELSINIGNEFHDVTNSIEKIKEALRAIQKLTQATIPEFASNKNMDLESLLSTEMEQMDRAIHEAVLKIEQMIAAAHKQDTGVKLEVNAKILDACTSLMQAIKQLIQDSKQLQIEIASKERGSSSMKDFYQRNHRWTEGLISAAKTVAADANLLVETADKIIRGNGKFEELMAASQEIAAACAQLVVASRVKANSASENLAKLSKSSKLVLQATGNVIATTKHCNKLIEESDVTDFSKLSLHQAKRLEMECQVKVLELENLLEKERLRLASIRRTHYHLAESLSTNNN